MISRRDATRWVEGVGFPTTNHYFERTSVDGYAFLYHQPRRAWSFELDVRTSNESW